MIILEVHSQYQQHYDCNDPTAAPNQSADDHPTTSRDPDNSTSTQHLDSPDNNIIGPNKFKCPECSRSCSTQIVYQRHMRTHTGEKPYSCQLCPEAFALNSNLARHMRTHTGERPFTCPCCSYAASNGSNLKRHMRFVHRADQTNLRMEIVRSK